MEEKHVDITKEIISHSLQKDTCGVFYCDKCQKVVGQIPRSRIGRIAARQVAVIHAEQRGHEIEELRSEKRSLATPNKIKPDSDENESNLFSFIFENRS